MVMIINSLPTTHEGDGIVYVCTLNNESLWHEYTSQLLCPTYGICAYFAHNYLLCSN